LKQNPALIEDLINSAKGGNLVDLRFMIELGGEYMLVTDGG